MSLLAATNQACIEIERLKSHTSPSLQDLFVRFEIWTGNNGALRTDQLSLQWRVRKVKILQDMLLERLNDLVEDLRLAREISVGSEPDLDDIGALINAAHENVSALFKLSAIAKRSALRDPFVNALARVGPERVTSEEDEAEAVGDRFPRLRQPQLKWLLRKLAQANGQRKRFLLHRQLHQERVLADEVPEVEPATIAVNLPDHRSEVSNDLSVATSIDLASFSKTLSLNEQDDDTASQTSYMSYATVSGEDQLFSVRRLEAISEGRTLFVCPYCREEQMIKTQSAWERHVHADLRTYVCTFEGCGLSLFSTSHAWLQHHIDHLQRSRQGIDDEETDTIPTAACQFCDWSSKMAYSKMSTRAPRVSQKRYRRHICAHLEQVALLTIDHDEVEQETEEEEYGDDDDDDDEATVNPILGSDGAMLTDHTENANDYPHWARAIFDDAYPATPFRRGYDTQEGSRCDGVASPDAVGRLQQDGFNRVLELYFDSETLSLRFYHRPHDNRARLLFISKKITFHCIALTSLRAIRGKSEIQLCRVRSDGTLERWALLNFASFERMALFHSTFVAMKRQDDAELSDPRLIESDNELHERVHFDGKLRHGKMIHELQLKEDVPSGVFRLVASPLRGLMAGVPLWTAFVTRYHLHRDHAWAQYREGDSQVWLAALKPQPYIFLDGYSLPTQGHEWLLDFVEIQDAKDFVTTWIALCHRNQ